MPLAPTETRLEVASNIMNFTMENLSVAVGTTIFWQSQGTAPHTTTPGVPADNTDIWDSDTRDNGQTFEVSRFADVNSDAEAFIFPEQAFVLGNEYHMLQHGINVATSLASAVHNPVLAIGYVLGSMVAHSNYAVDIDSLGNIPAAYARHDRHE